MAEVTVGRFQEVGPVQIESRFHFFKAELPEDVWDRVRARHNLPKRMRHTCYSHGVRKREGRGVGPWVRPSAPIVKLSKVVERFVAHGLDGEKVASRLADIKAQRVTNMFYLPADGLLDEDHVALLDDLHLMPVEVHRRDAEKLFTLSMAGFYLFVFKLSVHFCQLHEDVDRSPRIAAA